MSSSKRVKYIVVLALDDPDYRRLEALVFSETMAHKEVSYISGSSRHVVGAGFVEVINNGGEPDVALSGRSESLGIGPSELDLDYVRMAMGVGHQIDHAYPSDKTMRLAHYNRGVEIVTGRRTKS